MKTAQLRHVVRALFCFY